MRKGGIFIRTKSCPAAPAASKNRASSGIETRAFLVVVSVLLAILLLCSSLSYVIPQGAFSRDDAGNILPNTYQAGEVRGIALWRVLTAPVRVFASEDALSIIMISLFLLIMNGVFRILEETGGIKIFVVSIMTRFRHRSRLIVCITVLIFMLFGSLFGLFEELVTLLPLIIVFMLSMQMDTMMGLGTCMTAACFGFSTAITNPFSVGTAAQLAGVYVSQGIWLRILFFVIVYVFLCWFLLRYLNKIRQNPALSPTYADDLQKHEQLLGGLQDELENPKKALRVYSVFFAVQGVALAAIAFIRSISGFAIPILAASFLITGLISGVLVCGSFGRVLSCFAKGAAGMLPAVGMIALASSVKLVMVESHIIDTVMHFVLQRLVGKGTFVTILLIYFLILFLQLFIGSASAKIFLVMPIVLPITAALGISPQLVILTYCMADGFTDVILPTNPVLLIGLSMAKVSYWKWLKWSWKLQVNLFLISVLVLLLGVFIGY